jgi:transglutaminase-like putative cysteine protease
MAILPRAPSAPFDARALPALYGFVALAAAPHVLHQPWWVSAALAGALGWCLAPRLPRPNRLVRLLFALLSAWLVYRQFHSFFGRDPGFALLIMLGGLKLFEVRNARDYTVVALLFLVVLGGAFLFDQSLWMGAYAALVVLAALGALLRLAAPRVSPGRRWRLAAVLMLQALPLMLALYFLFPRLHGALWGLPLESGAARAGLAETMHPGSVGSLVDSGEVAFRASFEGQAPAPGERYWRALVLWHTDGRGWERGEPRAERARLTPRAEPYRYRILLEPSDKPMLPALDLPVTAPAGARLAAGHTLERRTPATERHEYALASYPRYRTGELAEAERAAALQLPANVSARVRALAARFAAGGDAAATARAALAHFRSQPFVYTLRPPLLDADPVDEFLFETRRGFCEHYAGAFVTLMRAAGVPARVVLGYLGGEYNAAGNYLLVHQSDAHAWAEVWVAGDGWVRVDPTGAVAPERVEFGLDAIRRLEAQGLRAGGIAGEALARAIRLGGFEGAWLRSRLLWDYANLAWYRWVTDYTPERQRGLLDVLGLGAVTRAQLLGALGGAIALTGLGYLLWFGRRRAARDPVQALYRRLCRRLARQGLARAPHEGASAFAARVAAKRPDLAEPLAEITALYEELRYGAAEVRAARFAVLRRKIASCRP